MIARAMAMSIVLGATVPVMGQASRVQTGRANDASLRVGSGGYNLPYRENAPRLGSDIMTGNVTRGRHFRGSTSIGATTDYGSTLWSTSLDDFRRDSIGVDDLQSGYRGFQPRRFYSPSGTVTSAGDLSVGFRPNAPRTSRQNYISLPSDPLGRRSANPEPFSRQIRIDRGSDRPGPTPTRDQWSAGQDETLPQTRSSLFGVAPDPLTTEAELRTRAGLTRPMSRTETLPGVRTRPETETSEESQEPLPTPGRPTYRPPSGSPFDRLLNPDRIGTTPVPGLPSESTDQTSTEARGSLGERPASRVRQYGQPEVPPSGESGRTEGATGRTGVTPGVLGQRTASRFRLYGAPEAATGEPTDSAGAGAGASRLDTGGDVYRTILKASSVLQEMAPAGQLPEARPGAVADPARAEGGPSPEGGAEEPAAAPRTSLLGQEHERFRELLSKPVVTFAGSAKTLANEAFKKAERQLAAGKYFDAVTAYDVARAADRENPLVWIGRGHALIGAGDYLSAASSLEEGLRRFPQIAQLRIDLKAFLSYRDVLDIRRADLERRLEESESYQLRFLLGYIEYFMGLEKFGRPNLERASLEAPSTSIISKLPALLPKGK